MGRNSDVVLYAPLVTLCFAVAFNVVIASLSIPKEMKLLAATKTTATATKSRRPRSSTSTKPPAFVKPISIEWPIVALASLVLLVGVCFSLFRRKQDLDRAIQLGKMVAEVKYGTAKIVDDLPGNVKSMYSAAKSKIGVEIL